MLETLRNYIKESEKKGQPIPIKAVTWGGEENATFRSFIEYYKDDPEPAVAVYLDSVPGPALTYVWSTEANCFVLQRDTDYLRFPSCPSGAVPTHTTAH